MAIFCPQNYGKLFIEIKILKIRNFWGHESLNCNILTQKMQIFTISRF